MVPVAMDVYNRLKEEGVNTTVVNCSTLKPLDEVYLSSVPRTAAVFTLEEHMVTGGFGEYVSSFCIENGYTVPTHCFGVRDQYIQHGNHAQLMKDAGLDAESVADVIRKLLKGA